VSQPKAALPKRAGYMCFLQQRIAAVALVCSVLGAELVGAQTPKQRYIVCFKQHTTAAASVVTKTERNLRTEPVFGFQTVATISDDKAVVALLSAEEARALPQRSDVESVELDQILHSTRTTNDRYISRLYGLRQFPGIAAMSAWDATIGTPKALVAVIDSGIDFTHPDLQGAVWHNPGEIKENGRDDDRNGLIDDYYGYDFFNQDSAAFDDYEHGTHVSGIIAARGDNRRGVVGVAWGTQVVPLKVLDQNGSAYSSDIIQALDYVGTLRGQGYPVVAVNMSLAGPHSAALERAVRRSLYNNILIVAAAGNESRNLDEGSLPIFPARYRLPHIVSVAAVDQFGNLSSYSNYGQSAVALAAPGDDIYSTLPRYVSGASYGYLSGTSMAAPHVSGVAALIAAVNPHLTAPLIREVLINSARNNPALQGLTRSGSVVDAASAVAQARVTSHTFRIIGRVTKRGVGVAGVTVRAQALGKRVARATTSVNGHYRLLRLESASYNLTARKNTSRFVPHRSRIVLYRNRRKDFKALSIK
jgi:subtilisin family serine protease